MAWRALPGGGLAGYDWRPLAGAEEKLNAEIAPLTAMVADGEIRRSNR
jgi:hypothetical protein